MASIFERPSPVIADPLESLTPIQQERAAAMFIAHKCRQDDDVDNVVALAVYIMDGPAAMAEFYAERKAADSALEMQEERMRMMGQPLRLPEYAEEPLPPVGSPLYFDGGRPGHVHTFEENAP